MSILIQNKNNDQISFIIIRHPRSDAFGIRTQKMSDIN